jgi:hypothetical protein
MCTELFLAIVYFITIFIVNIFLYKLLKNYFSNIIYFLKLKNILNSFSIFESELVSFFYLCSKNEFKNQNLLANFNNLSTKEDILVIGNSYKYFYDNLSTKNTKFLSLNYYLKLIESQYLSKTIF